MHTTPPLSMPITPTALSMHLYRKEKGELTSKLAASEQQNKELSEDRASAEWVDDVVVLLVVLLS